MGGWRHFGDRLEFPAASPGCDVLSESLSGSAFEQTPDADRMRIRLASVIEAEILPRLMLAHKDFRQVPLPPTGRRPMPEEVEHLCDLLLLQTETDVAPHILRFLDEGLTLESVLVELLTPAARHLGRLWEEDSCDFLAVTTALGRLQAVARDLCMRFEDDAVEPSGRSILLLPCPGETHVFCLSIVAAVFREAGWDVTTACPGSSPDILGLVAADWFDVVGLTLSCDVFLPAMPAAIRSLRTRSCNPAIKVLVGGPYFARNPDRVRLVGADASAEDGRLAPLIAESLLEMRARAC